MPEFKCISCGAVKEGEKQRSCPECGYKMFEMPYERDPMIRKEIRQFVSRLRPQKAPREQFIICRNVSLGYKNEDGEEVFQTVSKTEDDERFPPFSKIQSYVCASTKTEVFCERANETIEQIRNYLYTPYMRQYTVSFDNISDEIARYDEVLKKVIPALGLEDELPTIQLPDLSLDYSETPNESLLQIVDEILDDLAALTDKIKKFIRQNNVYGTAYQKKSNLNYKPSNQKDYASDLKRYRDILSKVLAKRYIVDIFSDGTEEMGEMLKALWNAIQIVLSVPVLEKKYAYFLQDGMISDNEGVEAVLLDRINSRYMSLDEALDAPDFLIDQSDDALFALYDKMIELDDYGFMGVKRSELLKIGESEAKLNALIGLESVKESIRKIKAYVLSNKESDKLNIHMCFLGNPGCGKTEVARIIAGILYENKILPSRDVVEVDRSGLVSQYFGATAEKTKGVISRAMGGVLFIDEAYALGNNSDTGITDYGKEAIDTLVKAMEDHRGEFCVIFAGYRNEMQKMLSVNPGLKSRIQFTLDFPNYSRDELHRIADMMLVRRQYTIGNDAMSRILDITDIRRKDPNFANAREIRNILDQVIMCQNIRTSGSDDKEIGIIDVNRYIQDAKINLPTSGSGKEKKILTGEEELDQLIGLSAVKRMIKKIKAYAKRNKGEFGFNLHMCFYGNPGTGKTEVARILSRILYDAGVLGEAKLVETDGQSLLGQYVGETAPKTEAKINDAMNGVLFIDEAYSLVGSSTANGGSLNYGDEAIAVLLKEMEDHRGQFCVILAGYKDEMKTLISANPGFESRIQFSLDFPDYSREELGEIAKVFLSKKGYQIEADALQRILDITDYFRKQPNFANARTVRNILDQVLMNQNLRTEDSEDNGDLIIIDDVEDYLSDEGIDLNKQNNGSTAIGFH